MIKWPLFSFFKNFDFHSFFLLIVSRKTLYFVSIFKHKRVKKEENKIRRYIFFSHFWDYSPVSAELSLAEAKSLLAADDPWHKVEPFQLCTPEISWAQIHTSHQGWAKERRNQKKLENEAWALSVLFHLESFNLISFLSTNRSLT